MAYVLADKTSLAARLFEAYAADDRVALAAVAERVLYVLDSLDNLAASFRSRWLASCQPFGLEVIQIRMAGQIARYRELEQRLKEYLAGEIDTIAEFEHSARGAYLPDRSLSYRGLASAARVF